MSARLLFLGLVSAVAALGQGSTGYGYDYSGPVTSSSMTQNGSAPSWTPVAQFAGSGSLIWNPAVTGANPNDYEVSTTITLAAGGGTYVNYLRASSNALASPGVCAGSYISVEVAVPSSYELGGAAAQLNVNQCAGGILSSLSSNSVAFFSGDTVRAVVWGSNLWVFVTNRLWVSMGVVSAATGQPGIGGYGQAAASGFSNVSIGHHDVMAPSAVSATGVRSSIQPSNVSLAWQGASDDAAGIGVGGYAVFRDGYCLGYFPGISTTRTGT